MSTTLDERFVELSLGRLRLLESAGDGGRTVLFLHGITSSARTWEPFLAALPHGVRGISLDTFGNGYSELRGGHRPITVEDHANEVLQLVDDIGLRRAPVLRDVCPSLPPWL